MTSKEMNEASDECGERSSGRGGGGGCEGDCLSDCCLLQGSKLPFYSFSKIEDGFEMPSATKQPRESFLSKLLEQWEKRNRRGLFHHDIATCETRVLPGDYGFILRLIKDRDLKKRPSELRNDKVLQPFDEKKFNFTKIAQQEVIFRFEESESCMNNYLGTSSMFDPGSLNIIAINVSPIGHGHVLLLPHILKRSAQKMDREGLLLSLYMSREASSPYFRVIYNSLGAFATINHLHFQAFHFPMLLPVEKASTEWISTLRSGVRILQLLRYPVRGFVYKLGTSLHDLADAVSISCTFLQERNDPYNLLISESGKSVFIFPQCYAERIALGEVEQEIIDTQVNPAAWEISGFLVLKRREDFVEATEEKVCRFFTHVSLSEESFQEMQESILHALHGADAGPDHEMESQLFQ